MRVTLRQLNVFEAVARLLSYTKAAEALHLSQPAVSMQIRQLEDEVGLELFEKLGKKIQLTEAGSELFGYSQAINRQLQEAEEVLEHLKGLSRGRLKIAVASTINYYAPRLLAAFSKRYPGIGLHLDVTNRKTQVRLLEANEADMVLMGKPPGPRDFRCARARLRHAPGDGEVLYRKRTEVASVDGNDPGRGHQAGSARWHGTCLCVDSYHRAGGGDRALGHIGR